MSEYPAWAVWRRLVAEFKTSRLLGTTFGSGMALGLYGVDLASSLRRTPTARRALVLLETVDDATLADLAAIAEVNVQRNDAMWRLAVMFYVTVPATIVVAGIDAAPDIIAEIIRPLALLLLILLPLLTIQLLLYFATHWRARQIAAVLEFARIERGGRVRVGAPTVRRKRPGGDKSGPG